LCRVTGGHNGGPSRLSSDQALLYCSQNNICHHLLRRGDVPVIVEVINVTDNRCKEVTRRLNEGFSIKYLLNASQPR